MSLTIETGAKVTGADSYASVSEFNTYVDQTGITLSGDEEELLRQAMAYIEGLAFKGYKLTKAQPLQWPRGNVILDGYYVDATEIPTLLKEAQMEVAIAVDQGNNPLAAIDRLTKREKVGEIEVEYMDGASSATRLLAVQNKLKKLTLSNSGITVPVTR